MYATQTRHGHDAGLTPAAPHLRPQTRAPIAIQRKCACGGSCPRCSQEQQTNFHVNTPGDAHEQEADRIAARVAGPGPSLQRKPDDNRESTSGANVSRVLNEPGRPLDDKTRSLMESRIGHDFSGVRLHEGPLAEQSARDLSALAYTVGDHIVFAGGHDDSPASRNLLAHELVHTVQQRASGASVMRRYRHADCADQPTGKWIDKITIDQNTPQSITAHWRNDDGSDGGTDTDQCSTGKGHCCVDSTSGSSGTCSPFTSRLDGTNCTPIGKKTVVRHVRDHGGINFWTEIDTGRAIAMHEYAPVDGTPLSHGCVRLNTAMAQKIWCGAVDGQTVVEILNVARPMCDHAALQAEWNGDFSLAASDLPKDGETRRQILEARMEMRAAFGKSHTQEEFSKMTDADIPRCAPPKSRITP